MRIRSGKLIREQHRSSQTNIGNASSQEAGCRRGKGGGGGGSGNEDSSCEACNT